MNSTTDELKAKYSGFFNFLDKQKDISYKIYDTRTYIYPHIYPHKHMTLRIEESDNVENIPPNTSFYVSVRIENSKLKTIGEHVMVSNNPSDNLLACFTGEVPESKNLTLVDCPNLDSIGNDFYIDGKLIISNTKKLKTLPNNMFAKIMILNEVNIENVGEEIRIDNLEPRDYLTNHIDKIKASALIIDYTNPNDGVFKNINKIKDLEIIKVQCKIISQKHKNIFFKQILSDQQREHLEFNGFVLGNEVSFSFFSQINTLGYTMVTNNYLALKSPNSLCSKLINEEYDLITDEEIKKYLNNNVYLIGKKIPVSIIDYCFNKKAFSLIKQLGYKFSEKEFKRLKRLSNSTIKGYYEAELISQRIKNKENHNDSINNKKILLNNDFL